MPRPLTPVERRTLALAGLGGAAYLAHRQLPDVTLAGARPVPPLLSHAQGVALRNQLRPGDLILTRNDHGWPAQMIRLGAAMRDLPNLRNHGIIVHHIAPDGRVWGMEGRPGGFGPVEITVRMMRSPYTLTNVDQPRAEAGRYLAAKAAEDLVGIPYDWEGILFEGFASVGINLRDGSWGERIPGGVYCTNALAWIHLTVRRLLLEAAKSAAERAVVGWEAPVKRLDQARAVPPALWDFFITTNRSRWVAENARAA